MSRGGGLKIFEKWPGHYLLVEVAGKNIKMSAVVVSFLGVKTFGMADTNWVDINCEVDIFCVRKNVQGRGW